MISLPQQQMNGVTNPIELYHESYGDGAPLLCIHGFGASLYSWRNFIGPLSKDNQLILIDLKGCGKSPKPNDTKYSPLDQAELIHQFILKHDLKNLTLVGNSLGGALSLLMAIIFMGTGELARLRSIILIDAGAYKEYIPFYLRLLSVPILNLPAYLLPSRLIAERVLRMAYYDPNKITEEQIASYAAPLLSTAYLVLAGYAAASASLTLAAFLISGGGLIAAKDMILPSRVLAKK